MNLLLKKEKIIWGLVLLVFYAFYAYLFSSNSLYGDENYYFRTSLQIKKFFVAFLSFNFKDIPELYNSIIHAGFYIPGISILLAPLRFFTDSIIYCRLFIGCLNFILIFLICLDIERIFNTKRSFIFLLIICSIPAVGFFSFSFWGESLGGFIVLLYFLKLNIYVKQSKESDSKVISKNKILKLSLLFALCSIIRHSFILIAPISLFFVLFIGFNQKLKIKPQILKLLTLSVYFTFFHSILIIIWSLMLIPKFGCCYLSTTTTKSAKLYRTFSDQKIEKEKILRNGDSFLYWGHFHKYISKIAVNSGITYWKVLDNELKRTSMLYPEKSYIQKKKDQIDSLRNSKKDFLIRAIIRNGYLKYNSNVISYIYSFIVNLQTYYLLILFISISFLFVFFLNNSTYIYMGILYKLFLIAVLFQVLFMSGHIRHTYGSLPFIIFGITTILFQKRAVYFNIKFDKIAFSQITLNILFILFIVTLFFNR